MNVRVCVCVSMNVRVLCVYLCIYVSMYECVCVCMHVYMLTGFKQITNEQVIHKHTHTHTHTLIHRPYRKNVLSYHWPRAINLFHDDNIFILGLESLVSELCSLASRLKEYFWTLSRRNVCYDIRACRIVDIG